MSFFVSIVVSIHVTPQASIAAVFRQSAGYVSLVAAVIFSAG